MDLRILLSFLLSLVFVAQASSQSIPTTRLPAIYKQIGPTLKLRPRLPPGISFPTYPGPVVRKPTPPPPRKNPTSKVPEKRTIHFVHGLTGTEASWGNAAAAIDIKYDVEAETPSWEGYQTLPLESASNRLEQDLIEHRDADPERAFIVAHSMGGLAAREIDRQYAAGEVTSAERKFHGLVTVTTPHGGAQVVNSMRASQAFLTFACKSIAAAKFEDLFDENFRLRWLINLTGVDAKVDRVSETLCGPVLDNVVDFLVLDKLINRSAEDIEVNSPFMKRLKRHQVTIPSVNVVATEDAPAFWKLATNFMNAPNDNEPFRAREDSDLEKFAKENERKYAQKRDHHATRKNYYRRVWPINWGKSRAHDAAKRGYAKGVVFFKSANNLWLSNIGAVRNEQIVDYYQCNCSNGRVFDTDAVYKCASQRGCSATAVVNEVRVHIEASDGLVRESAQKAWNAENIYSIHNNNHLQVRNSPEIGEFFDDFLFKGVDVNKFFKTERR